MRKSLFAAMASAGLLVACGGGGSDAPAAGATIDTPTAPVTSATVALSGTAAKGLMANADVGVYAVEADGSITGTALATTTTGLDGRYSLSFVGTKDQPYVVKVSAKADGSTTHADEVSGLAQPLPAGFVMRSLVVPAASGAVTASASITPFSEMAVAAAAKASGGITAANAAQAVSTVTQLLGFDPTQVTATTVDGATGSNEQKLAVMLTAVSQMAASGDLGCSTGSAGDKTQCVVAALGAAARTDSIQLGDNGHNVSATLAEAVTTVLASDAVRAQVDASVLTTVVANLGCTSSCNAAPVGSTAGTPSAEATAIAAAKLLFSEIKTDWSAMFSRGGASSIAGGALNQQAFKFSTAMSAVQVPVKLLTNDLGTMLMGIDLYNDYKAGRTGSNSRSRGNTAQVANDGSVPDNGSVPAGCTLYQDANTSIPATSPDNANTIGCGARYFVSWTPGANGSTTVTEWRHGITLTPAGGGSFSYTAAAKKRVQSCAAAPSGCTTTSHGALQKDAAGNTVVGSGTLTATLSTALGDITSFTLEGDLPAAFEDGSHTLLAGSYKHKASFSGTQTVAGVGDVVSTLQGQLLALDASGATTATLTVQPGSTLSNAPIAVDAYGNEVQIGSPTAVTGTHGGSPSGLTLNLVFGTAEAEFEGSLALTDTAWDQSGTQLSPTKAMLSGALRNTDASGTTEFLKGALSATVTGASGYNATLPKSASNSYTTNVSFVGTLTSPHRPTLEISAASGSVNDSPSGRPIALTMQYRTLVNGVPRLVVSLVADRAQPGGLVPVGDVTSVTLSEATAKLTMQWAPDASTADLYVANTTKIGTLATGSGLLTFSDASFISLDIGL